jgi:hypothetical protein
MATDMEVEQLRARTHCATVLERLAEGWKLDRRESTRDCLKYRRGPGEILIINHGGRGWWDPQGEAKGDVFDLVQHLCPSLNFGMVRRELRQLAGIAPSYPRLQLRRSRENVPVGSRWQDRPRLIRGSRSWRYLAERRALPPRVLVAAIAADAIREGPHGSAWFAHRDASGAITGIEMRGPRFRGFTTNGTKTLFRLPGSSGHLVRIVLGEGPITIASLAALERLRADTLYAATGGGMGPETITTIEALLEPLAGGTSASLVSAADNDTAGERHAARHEALAGDAQIRFERLRPPNGLKDWNDVLRCGRS